MPNTFVTLRRDENQALGLGRFAIDFLAGKLGTPSEAVVRRTLLFHADSVACALSALDAGTNAPLVLRNEARFGGAARFDGLQSGFKLEAYCFGERMPLRPEKAVAANCAAVREWDANGTNFGYNPALGNVAGEFGHNDFYPVVFAAAACAPCDGRRAVLAMILLDEIRGRLAEVFALRKYKIDHVVHGAIASAVTFGALKWPIPEKIERAVGMVVAHYIPYRAIRSGHQLSDSKGASAAISAEAAVLSMIRAMLEFVGPGDIFRNPEAIFCLNEPPARPNESPFDLTLAGSGDDFAIMGMHFKLGLYEHQSAGAIQGLFDIVAQNATILDDLKKIRRVTISIYEPAFGIIGDPAKRDPHTRQSADHSMVYIIATLLRKGHEARWADWHTTMLMPEDYSDEALFHPITREIMAKIDFRHGGPEYDAKYPDGIPTSIEIEHDDVGTLSSGLVMYPAGHARDQQYDLEALLKLKFERLLSKIDCDPEALWNRLMAIGELNAEQTAELYADLPLYPDEVD